VFSCACMWYSYILPYMGYTEMAKGKCYIDVENDLQVQVLLELRKSKKKVTIRNRRAIRASKVVTEN